MSETKQDDSSNRNQNKNRQGGNRNGNRNRSGNNNNNRNRDGNNQNNQNKNRQGNRNGGNNGNRSHRKPAPKPLTFWQKILAFFGIKPQQQAPKSTRQPQKKESKPVAKKTSRPPQKVEVTSGRLYVGNLSYETTEYDLEELFKGNGSVKNVEIIYNRHTHKSKGYGFVEMLNVDDAKNAVKVHHDEPFMGRNLIVNGAKSRQPDENQEEREKSSSDAA